MYAVKMADLKVRTLRENQNARAGLYDPKDAERMSDREIRLHLCALGPEGCETCRACAYGRESLKRFFRIKGLTKKQIMEKYGASEPDVSAAIRGMKPVGTVKPAGYPLKVYDEAKVVKALTGIWRGRGVQYEKRAAEWKKRAEEAEKKYVEIMPV